MNDEKCIKCSRYVGWTVLGINLGLFLIKITFAIISHSYSLFADSFESFANLIITVIVLISLKIAEKGQDEKHQYGYGKIEYIASGGINVLLMMGTILFIIMSFKALISYGSEKPPELIAVFAAIISIIGNQLAYLYSKCVGERLHSPAILANAVVSQIDVFTSIAVIIAVVGSNLGIAFLDHLIAIIIAVFIIKTTAEGVNKSIIGLMDQSPKLQVKKIRDISLKVAGVNGIGVLKARQVGRDLWIDIEILISNTLKLQEGLNIVGKLKSALYNNISNIADISVQMIPEKS